MVRIEIYCPICSKKRILEITEEMIKETPRGIMSANIIDDKICLHNLLIYLDRNLNVRDIIPTDFTVHIPDIPKEKIEDLDLKKIEEFKTESIKMNLYPLSLIYILKACFYNKKILIINELEFLKPLLEEFCEIIFKDSFNYTILLKSKEEYETEKKKFKDYIILEGKNIIRDKQKILEYKKNKIEKQIVQKFFADYDSTSSLIILRNEIKKALNLSKTIIKLVQNIGKKEKLNINIILGKFKQKYRVLVSKDYLYFLIEIIENYFKIKVPIIYENILSFT